MLPALISRTALQNTIKMDISLEVGHVMPIVLKKVIQIPESWALVLEFSSRKSEISQMTTIRNPRSTDKESRIQYNPKRATQNPRFPWKNLILGECQPISRRVSSSQKAFFCNKK